MKARTLVFSLTRSHLFTLCFTCSLFLLAAGCNTVKGLGKDVTTVGEKSQELITGNKSATQPQ